MADLRYSFDQLMAAPCAVPERYKLISVGALGLIPGVKAVAICVEPDPSGEGVPVHVTTVIWEALAAAYGPSSPHLVQELER
ncbi:hypothetical protein [Actinocrispum wychmicini]|uniref:Uncharacterized protein n=1 Tax=Actinocrispum wychmicini TaxID=1213861 RepID=A0A4R2JJE8_9PSEU|nr:hypothetical protein [Actinocrispum wychmicini]TCO57136.1 hypothetical protein EV192_106613 [Actinocrispum wychmicini]